MTRLLRVALVIGCFGCLVALSPAPAVRAAELIPASGVTTYTLVPSQAKIAVRIDLVINSLPGYYVDEYAVYLEGTARAIKATTSSGSVKATLQTVASDIRPVRLTFPRIVSGQTKKITVTYDVPGAKPRSADFVRVGRAYALFCGFPNGNVFTSSLHLVVPDSFAVDTLGTTVKLERATKNGTLTLTAGPQVEPYAACIEAIDEAALVHDKVTTSDGRTVDVEGWPEDPTWMKDMARYVEAGVPLLEQLIGLPFPKTGRVIVREVESETLGGYGGMYDPTTQVARVSERSDDARLVLHELSHVWFNQALLGDIWFDEGSADHFGFAVAGRIGEGSGSCSPPGKYPGKGAPDLDHWQFLTSSRATAQEVRVVVWQYQASCWLVTLLADAVGDDRVRQIIVALANHEIPYTGSGPAETLPANADWHRWLDLADERGIGPAGAKLDLGGLLAAYGIGDAADLDRRGTLRTRYHELASEVGWAMRKLLPCLPGSATSGLKRCPR